MQEDVIGTTSYEEDFDPILPSGWKEGDDIFADSGSWTGESEFADEQAEDTVQEEPTEAGTENAEEAAPTTGETDTGSNGPDAEREAEETLSGQTEEPAKRSRILKLKVNHEDQEVDVESMSDEELITQLQKARAFDAMKDEQLKAKYRQTYQDEIDAGMTAATARLVAAAACDGRSYPLEDTAEQPTTAPSAAPVETSPVRRFDQEVQQLKALYPDFKEMPDEVAKAAANGTNLLTAYLAYREKQTSKAAASLKKENEVLKQNAASAAKAPVRGITGGGATNTKPKSDLLKGFDSVDW